jgi:hypothetical protein
MNCPNCSKPISSEDRFCGHCGYQLRSKNVEPSKEIQLQELKYQPQKVSNWWYLLALIWVGLIPLGAILAWAINKDKDPKKAKNFLIVGTVFGAILLLISLILIIPWYYVSRHEENTRQNRFILKYSQVIGKIECAIDKTKENFDVGTGFLINSEGYILTNYNVVKNSYFSHCIVMFPENLEDLTTKIYSAKITDVYDPDLDYAFLYLEKEWNESRKKMVDIENRNFPYIPACNSDIVNIGDPILILGYPSYGGETLTVTNGIISGSSDEYYFKTDAKIDKGNSGAPVLLDDPSKDCYIGIATFLIKGGSESLGYILKTKYIKGYSW